MTEQPEPPAIPASPAALRDSRWLAFGMWLAALLVLLVTSWAGQRTMAGVFDISFLSLLYDGSSGHPGEPNRELVASAAVVISVGLAVVLIVAWLSLAKATHALIAALSDSDDSAEDAPTAGIWLLGGRSPMSDVATYAGIAWGLIIVRPVLISAIQVFSS